MHNNLSIPLEPRLDGDGKIFHLGKLKCPVLIDLSQGITFLVFLSVSEEEELQIAVNDRGNTTYGRSYLRQDKMKIPLDKKEDRWKSPFFVAKVKHPGLIRANDEVCFLVFSSREGQEELQISGSFWELEEISEAYQPKEIEVIRRGYGAD